MEFSKYNNVEQLNIDFVCTTMLYWFVKWEQEVNRKLFMPSEQGRWFAEIAADGLLRGNTADRAALYASGRQWGWLSINDIHRKENMNPIGTAGDSYLDPLNMVPAGTPPQAKLPAKPAPKEDKPDDESVRAAHRALLASQWRRIITRQVNALQKGAKEDFWPGQRDFAAMLLLDGSAAYAAVRGIGREKTAEGTRRFVNLLVTPDANLSENDAEWLADELMQEIGGNHHAISQA